MFGPRETPATPSFRWAAVVAVALPSSREVQIPIRRSGALIYQPIHQPQPMTLHLWAIARTLLLSQDVRRVIASLPIPAAHWVQRLAEHRALADHRLRSIPFAIFHDAPLHFAVPVRRIPRAPYTGPDRVAVPSANCSFTSPFEVRPQAIAWVGRWVVTRHWLTRVMPDGGVGVAKVEALVRF